MKRKLTAGQTSVSLPIFIQDTASTTGGGLSGLTSGTSGLVAEYRRRGQSAWTAITLASGTLGTWSSGGFVADGALGGAYELGLPNAVCASGERWVAVRLRGAANMLPCLIEIELDVVDYQTAIFGAMASYTQPTGFLAATFPATVSSYSGGAVASVTGAVGSVTGNVGGNVVGSVGSVTSGVTVTTNNDKSGYSLLSTGLNLVTTWTVNITGSLSGAVGSVTGAVGSVTGNVEGNLNGNVVGSVASVTGNVGGNVVGSTGSVVGAVGSVSGNVGGNVSGNVSGSVGSVTGAVGSVTGSVGSVVGNVGGSTASVTGAVGSVTGSVGGNVSGKVLGGGAGAITGDGVRAASVTGAVGSVTGSVGSVVGAVVLDPAVETQIDNIENASGYLLAVLAGACADPQTASETYAITVFGSTFTVDMAGQTSTGTRTAPTLTKA